MVVCVVGVVVVWCGGVGLRVYDLKAVVVGWWCMNVIEVEMMMRWWRWVCDSSSGDS